MSARARTRTGIEGGDSLLSADTVVDYVRARGLLAAAGARVSVLGGGVSNVVLAVLPDDGPGLVVKQALPRLRVQADWRAKRERALVEAAALELLGAISPGHVPRVIDVDADVCALTIEHAPVDWMTWKSRLLDGDAVGPASLPELDAAERLGRLLASWHAATRDEERLSRFDDREVFAQLRVDPFYRTIAARHEELVEPVAVAIEEMEGFRRCLVHGDFSPKNVLLPPRGRRDDGGLWAIDCEVAHRGDPVFDVAFMLSHLTLKAIARPPRAAAQRAYATRFLAAYDAAIPTALARPRTSLLRHVGLLLVARVDGKSPVEYLDRAGRLQARRLGLALACRAPRHLDELWRELAPAP